jgi:hypothetical protein
MDTAKVTEWALQQGPAVVICIAIACAFAWAIVALFKANREERKEAADALKLAHADCRDERKQDRAEWLAGLKENSDAIRELSADIRRRGAA